MGYRSSPRMSLVLRIEREVIMRSRGPQTMLFFALATNVIVSSMLILGGSATVTVCSSVSDCFRFTYSIEQDLTGMPTLAACFLIPIGCVALFPS